MSFAYTVKDMEATFNSEDVKCYTDKKEGVEVVEEEKKEAVEVVEVVEVVEEKKRNGKKETLRTCRKSDRIPALYDMIPIQQLLKDGAPHLLKRPEVIRAFNNVVDILVRNKDHILPTNRAYPRNVKPYYQYNETTLAIEPEINILRKDGNRISIGLEIRQTYQTLYVLIKDDLLPYMEKMRNAIDKKEINKKLEICMKSLEKLREKHEKSVANKMEQIAKLKMGYERQANDIRRRIEQYANDIQPTNP